MADNNKDVAVAAPKPDVIQDAELQNVESRTEQVAMLEPDAKPWYRTPHIIRLNLLMVSGRPEWVDSVLRAPMLTTIY